MKLRQYSVKINFQPYFLLVPFHFTKFTVSHISKFLWFSAHFSYQSVPLDLWWFADLYHICAAIFKLGTQNHSFYEVLTYLAHISKESWFKAYKPERTLAATPVQNDTT